MHSDILIIGGGIVGSAIAYHLARGGRSGDIIVVEPDPTYALAATPRGNGGIRQLFSLPENIAMAQYGLSFFRRFETDMAVDGDPAPIGFRRQGYLFISDRGGERQMENNFRLQAANGVGADCLDRDALQARFPSLRTDDVALAVHSPDDAWIDPYAALQGFRRKARSLGVRYLTDAVVDWRGDGHLARRAILASGATVDADIHVLAAGAWSADIGAMIGLALPVEPMARETHFFRPAAKIEKLPFIKTESHLAFRPEGGGFAGGLPDWSVSAGWNFDASPDGFEKIVWPAVAHRVPALETLKLERTWVGHYARNTLDLSAIVGAWTGGFENVFMAVGFSGHGIMHAPAAGRALAELILDGGFQTLDLSRFGWSRVPEARPYRERSIV
ncbi:MAG: FAD-binding oxidoreductase [Rhodospirillales bacterium]|jgi:glycine/D-amino acid oxidase-like deaminating enzyme|nr:FAD-binding oxidoreductase [Rhodospirillales bacterium]MDP6882707.1 FAD-binding oxidoreductase [Rhodospirillales bacterium]